MESVKQTITIGYIIWDRLRLIGYINLFQDLDLSIIFLSRWKIIMIILQQLSSLRNDKYSNGANHM